MENSSFQTVAVRGFKIVAQPHTKGLLSLVRVRILVWAVLGTLDGVDRPAAMDGH